MKVYSGTVTYNGVQQHKGRPSDGKIRPPPTIFGGEIYHFRWKKNCFAVFKIFRFCRGSSFFAQETCFPRLKETVHSLEGTFPNPSLILRWKKSNVRKNRFWITKQKDFA